MLVAFVRYCVLLDLDCESLICVDCIPLFVINDKCVAPTFSFEWNKEVLDYLACTSLHIMLQS